MLGTLSHPQIVHLPIALSVLMPLIAGGVLLAWHQEWLPSRAWFIVVLLQFLLVGSAMAALQSGENDEDVAEKVVSERFIEEHEEAAEAFTTAAAVLGAVMLLALLPLGARWRIPLAGASVAGTAVILALGYQTGRVGGELVYTHGAAQAFIATSPGSGLAVPTGHDDDDDDDDDDD